MSDTTNSTGPEGPNFHAHTSDDGPCGYCGQDADQCPRRYCPSCPPGCTVNVPPSEPAQVQNATLAADQGSRVSVDRPEVLSEAERALVADAARLAEAATPGPWLLDGPSWHRDDEVSLVVNSDRRAIVIEPPKDLAADASELANVKLIAWSREGVPSLLALVERLAGEVALQRDDIKLMVRTIAGTVDELEESERYAERVTAERDRARATAALLEADGARLRERIAALADEMQRGRLIPGTPVFGCAACGVPNESEPCQDHDEGLQHAGDMLRALLAEGGE